MTKKESIQREKNFRRLCAWMKEAAEIAETIYNELPEYKRRVLLKFSSECTNPEEQGIASAYQMLNFMTALYEDPINNEAEPDNQRDEYPELAFGMMELARIVGQMKMNDEDKSGFGI